MIMLTTDYNNIPGPLPFPKPVHPGAFTPIAPAAPPTVATPTTAATVAAPVSTTLTPGEITTQKIAYDERLWLFNE